MFIFWWLARLVDGFEPQLQPLSSQKMKYSFLDYVQLLMIGMAGWWIWTPSTTLSGQKMKCWFLDYVYLLMISQAGQWTWAPSDTHQPKKWNAHFWITFNFCWWAGLVDGHESYPPPLSSQKNEMLILVLCSTSNDWPGWLMDLNPIHHLSPAKKWNADFWIMFNFWWLTRLVDGFEPQLQPLSSQKMKCLFLDYVQHLMIGRAGCLTQTPSATPLQPKDEMLIFGFHSTSDDWQGWLMDLNPNCNPSPAKKWNAHFWIMFNFWWLAGLVNGIKPHLPPPSRKKMKCSLYNNIQLLINSQTGQWTPAPSNTCLQPKNWNAHFWIMVNFWWSAGLVNGLKSCIPPLCSQKTEMLIFGLHSTSDYQLGWSMNSNPICHPTPSTEVECNPKMSISYFWLKRGDDGVWVHQPALLIIRSWK